MFKVLFAAAVLFAPAVSAQDLGAEDMPSAWYEAHAICRGAVDPGPSTPEQACKDRDTLTQMLTMHDYCWDEPEQEWIKCLPKP